jgi:putative FmdB family regulatory protein
MPVYELYCPDCHTIYSFFSRRVDTTTRPACPGCGRPDLDRQVSLFAISKGRGDKEEEDTGMPPGMDEEKMMRAFASMAGDFEGLDENDTKQAAGMMRRLLEGTGMKLGDGMAEAIRRMEAGEDPDQVETEMGDILEQEDPFAGAPTARSPLPKLKDLRRELLPPTRDEHWYPLRKASSAE